MKEFKIGPVIGTGSFASVRKIKRIANITLAKSTTKENLEEDVQIASEDSEEVKMTSKLNAEHARTLVLKIYDKYKLLDPLKAYFVKVNINLNI